MKIILATDGSPSALAALDFLIHFPFPENSEVHLLSVIDPSLYSAVGTEILDPGQQAAIAEAREALRHEAEELLAAEMSRLAAAGWACTTEVLHGEPNDVIVAAAERRGADLIVLGAQGTTDIRHFLLGGVSNHVLHYAPCSVLLVRHPARLPLRAPWHILLAYDDSPPAKQAVDFCKSLPLGAKDRVTTLSVLPLVTLFRQDIRQRLSPIWRQKKQAALTALQAATDGVRGSTAEVTAELREGASVCQEILDASERLDTQLIMLGDKGTRAFEKLLLGSVTNRIVRHADCAVWVVRSRS